MKTVSFPNNLNSDFRLVAHIQDANDSLTNRHPFVSRILFYCEDDGDDWLI